jgi:paraquat-inducible protein B
MSDSSASPSPQRQAVDALVERRTRFSVIWLVPLAAVLIGAWLVFKAIVEKGPTITIQFQSGEGIVAGKTKIKYKEVEAGSVDSVDLSEDLNTVIVTATLAKTLEHHLTDQTRFWVVRARVTAGEISGLGTLVSGAYIGMDPGEGGKKLRHFKGLATQPVVSAETKGRRFLLKAESLGSLEAGSPVYFRQIRAGRVTDYSLDRGGKAVTIQVFVEAPFDRLVLDNTRFWDASGISATLNAEGFRFRTESLTALLAGGVAFNTPQNLEPQGPVEQDHVFRLYPTLEAASESVYAEKRRYLLYFDGSVRGLKAGAPVEFRGIKVGQVLDMKLEADPVSMEVRIPVLIEIEPDRISYTGVRPVNRSTEEQQETMVALIKNGFRGQLKTGSMLTGQLYVDFDFFPDAPPAEVRREDGHLIVPTVPSPLDELRNNVTDFLAKLQRLPLEQIAQELHETLRGARELTTSPQLRQAIANLDQAVAETRQMVAQLNSDATPAVRSTLEQAQQTLALVQQNIIDQDAPIYGQLRRTLQELTQAARSIRIMADYLERHPDALLKGKR